MYNRQVEFNNTTKPLNICRYSLVIAHHEITTLNFIENAISSVSSNPGSSLVLIEYQAIDLPNYLKIRQATGLNACEELPGLWSMGYKRGCCEEKRHEFYVSGYMNACYNL